VLRAGGGQQLVRALVACVWIHLVLDTYADGIAWLWPLSERKIGLFQKPDGIRDRGWATPAPLGTKVGKLEAAFWALAALGAARSALWR
jgi:hypothetical protein